MTLAKDTVSVPVLPSEISSRGGSNRSSRTWESDLVAVLDCKILSIDISSDQRWAMIGR